jgi:hypothetical protein
MGLRAGLDNVKKRNFLPYRDSNSNPSFVQPVASRYTDYTCIIKTTDCAGQCPVLYHNNVTDTKGKRLDCFAKYCKQNHKSSLRAFSPDAFVVQNMDGHI